MSSTEKLSVDVAIIGAGPTGLFAAYYAGFRGLSMVIVDSLPEIGGQVTAMYPEKVIYDVGGFPAIRGRELVANLVEQTARWQPTYFLDRTAQLLHTNEKSIGIGLDSGEEISAGAVLITAGMGGFSPRPLPVGESWLGRGLVYFVPKLDVYTGQDVVVVGGGDSAFDWALALRPIAASVTIVHRRARFRAVESIVREAQDLGIRIITDAEVSDLRGDDAGNLSEVYIGPAGRGALGEDNHVTSTEVLPAQGLVAALGFTADLGPLSQWDLQVEHRAIPVDTTMATKRDRVYAAGDIVSYPGKVKLIATGFGEAATAINNIAVALNPEAHLFPGHSSDK